MRERTCARSFRLGLILLISLCAACTSLRPTAPTASGSTASSGQFYSGRFAVRYSQNQRNESAQGRFELLVEAGGKQLLLLSSLGTSLAKLSWDTQGAILEQANQPTQFGNTPNELVYELLGWPLPVASLPDWLGAAFQDLNKSEFKEFTAEGWRIDATRSADTTATAGRLRILVTHPGDAHHPAIELRLIVDQPDTKAL